MWTYLANIFGKCVYAEYINGSTCADVDHFNIGIGKNKTLFMWALADKICVIEIRF